MKLSELKTKGLIKALIYGQPGSGKTCFACSFPGPILLLDFDNKASSAARFYAKQPELLGQIEVVNLSASFAQSPLVEMNKIVTELSAQQKSGTYAYKTLILDSITTFSSACLKHIVDTNPGVNRVKSAQGVQPGPSDYGILKREFQRLIPGLLTLDMNVVMLGHEEVDKDELTGELIRGVQMDGSFSQQLPIYFEEVWRSYVDDKGVHKLQTKPDHKYSKLRSQIPGLPNVIDMKYDGIAKLL